MGGAIVLVVLLLVASDCPADCRHRPDQPHPHPRTPRGRTGSRPSPIDPQSVAAPAGVPAAHARRRPRPCRRPARRAPAARALRARRRPPRHLEQVIGRKWLGWVAILLIFGAAVFFLKYAFENRWIGELGRVYARRRRGLALVWGGHERHRKGMALPLAGPHRRRHHDPVSFGLRRLRLLPPGRPARRFCLPGHPGGGSASAGAGLRRPPDRRDGAGGRLPGSRPAQHRARPVRASCSPTSGCSTWACWRW